MLDNKDERRTGERTGSVKMKRQVFVLSEQPVRSRISSEEDAIWLTWAPRSADDFMGEFEPGDGVQIQVLDTHHISVNFQPDMRMYLLEVTVPDGDMDDPAQWTWGPRASCAVLLRGPVERYEDKSKNNDGRPGASSER